MKLDFTHSIPSTQSLAEYKKTKAEKSKNANEGGTASAGNPAPLKKRDSHLGLRDFYKSRELRRPSSQDSLRDCWLDPDKTLPEGRNIERGMYWPENREGFPIALRRVKVSEKDIESGHAEHRALPINMKTGEPLTDVAVEAHTIHSNDDRIYMAWKRAEDSKGKTDDEFEAEWRKTAEGKEWCNWAENTAAHPAHTGRDTLENAVGRVIDWRERDDPDDLLDLDGLKIAHYPLMPYGVKKADISNNRIDQDTFPKFPPTITEITARKTNLTALPLEITDPAIYPNLKIVNINENPLSPEEQERLRNLMADENYRGPVIMFDGAPEATIRDALERRMRPLLALPERKFKGKKVIDDTLRVIQASAYERPLKLSKLRGLSREELQGRVIVEFDEGEDKYQNPVIAVGNDGKILIKLLIRDNQEGDTKITAWITKKQYSNLIDLQEARKKLRQVFSKGSQTRAATGGLTSRDRAIEMSIKKRDKAYAAASASTSHLPQPASEIIGEVNAFLNEACDPAVPDEGDLLNSLSIDDENPSSTQNEKKPNYKNYPYLQRDLKPLEDDTVMAFLVKLTRCNTVQDMILYYPLLLDHLVKTKVLDLSKVFVNF